MYKYYSTVCRRSFRTNIFLNQGYVCFGYKLRRKCTWTATQMLAAISSRKTASSVSLNSSMISEGFTVIAQRNGVATALSCLGPKSVHQSTPEQVKGDSSSPTRRSKRRCCPTHTRTRASSPLASPTVYGTAPMTRCASSMSRESLSATKCHTISYFLTLNGRAVCSTNIPMKATGGAKEVASWTSTAH